MASVQRFLMRKINPNKRFLTRVELDSYNARVNEIQKPLKS